MKTALALDVESELRKVKSRLVGEKHDLNRTRESLHSQNEQGVSLGNVAASVAHETSVRSSYDDEPSLMNSGHSNAGNKARVSLSAEKAKLKLENSSRSIDNEYDDENFENDEAEVEEEEDAQDVSRSYMNHSKSLISIATDEEVEGEVEAPADVVDDEDDTGAASRYGAGEEDEEDDDDEIYTMPDDDYESMSGSMSSRKRPLKSGATIAMHVDAKNVTNEPVSGGKAYSPSAVETRYSRIRSPSPTKHKEAHRVEGAKHLVVLTQESPASSTSAAVQRRVVSMTFGGKLNRFPVIGFIHTLSDALEIDQDDIQVLALRAGSVIVDLSLPKSVADVLWEQCQDGSLPKVWHSDRTLNHGIVRPFHLDLLFFLHPRVPYLPGVDAEPWGIFPASDD